MSKVNSFKYTSAKCNGSFQRHVELSLREALAIEEPITKNDSALEKTGKAVARGLISLNDVLGFKKLKEVIDGTLPYKCCNCGKCAWRASDGEEKDFIGYSK